MIRFEKLKRLMDEKEIKKFYLRTHGISPAIVDKILSSGDVSTVTINKVCALLNCQPGDIMEYVPDQPETDKEQGGILHSEGDIIDGKFV